MDNMWFEKQFGEVYKKRLARKRSIEYIHDLWLRTAKRSLKKQAAISAAINEITEKVEKNSKGEYAAYFTYKKKYYAYTIRYEREFKSHSYSNTALTFSSDLATSRDEKLEFLLANALAFELGEKLRLAESYRSYKDHMVKQKMMDIIEDNLRKHFKETDTLPKDITIVEICSKKYYLKVDSEHRYGYLKFRLVGEVDETNCIKM